MVRNWQARVEQADVRRKQAKQKKQWSEDKKLWKQWIHECMKHQLDQNAPRIHQLLLSVLSNQVVKKTLTLQIWTDTKPSRSTNRSAAVTRNDDDEVENDANNPDQASLKKNQRSKSKSVGEIDDDDDEDQEEKGTPRGNKKGQRNRSNSSGGGNSSTTKKKAHPRSKEAMASQSPSEHLSSSTATSAAGNDNDDVSMCRSYFFTGNCPLVKKKHSCRYVHPHPSTDSNRTLHDALLPPTTTTTTTRRCTVDPAVQLPQSARAEMIAAERASTITTTVAAAAAASPDTATTTTTVDPIVGAMNMVYYVEVPISFDVSVNQDNPFCLLPSEQVTSVFIEQSLIFGNIVYMALNGILFL